MVLNIQHIFHFFKLIVVFPPPFRRQRGRQREGHRGENRQGRELRRTDHPSGRPRARHRPFHHRGRLPRQAVAVVPVRHDGDRLVGAGEDGHGIGAIEQATMEEHKAVRRRCRAAFFFAVFRATSSFLSPASSHLYDAKSFYTACLTVQRETKLKWEISQISFPNDQRPRHQSTFLSVLAYFSPRPDSGERSVQSICWISSQDSRRMPH